MLLRGRRYCFAALRALSVNLSAYAKAGGIDTMPPAGSNTPSCGPR
jgi:hypothetical protein